MAYDVRALRFLMRQPGRADIRGHLCLLQNFAQDLLPAGEMAAGNGMFGVRLTHRTAFVRRIGAQMCRGILIFQRFNAPLANIAEEKTNHDVGVEPSDECSDDGPQALLAAEAFKCAYSGHGIFHVRLGGLSGSPCV